MPAPAFPSQAPGILCSTMAQPRACIMAACVTERASQGGRCDPAGGGVLCGGMQCPASAGVRSTGGRGHTSTLGGCGCLRLMGMHGQHTAALLAGHWLFISDMLWCGCQGVWVLCGDHTYVYTHHCGRATCGWCMEQTQPESALLVMHLLCLEPAAATTPCQLSTGSGCCALVKMDVPYPTRRCPVQHMLWLGQQAAPSAWRLPIAHSRLSWCHAAHAVQWFDHGPGPALTVLPGAAEAPAGCHLSLIAWSTRTMCASDAETVQ